MPFSVHQIREYMILTCLDHLAKVVSAGSFTNKISGFVLLEYANILLSLKLFPAVFTTYFADSQRERRMKACGMSQEK